MSPRGSKKCSFASCRKFRLPNSEFCQVHAKKDIELENNKKEPSTPDDFLIHMTEIENYKLAALDAEANNLLLLMQNDDLRIESLKKSFEATISQLSNQKRQRQVELEVKKKEYTAFIRELAGKYELDPASMAFDTTSGILRDLREKT